MEKLPFVKLFTDYRETIDDLTDTEAGRLLKAIMHYADDAEEIKLPGAERLVYGIVRRQMERDREAYSAKADRNRENGQKGGRPRKPTETQKNPVGFSETQQNPQEPRKRQDKDKEEEKDKEKDQEEEKYSSSCAAASATPDESEVFFRLPTVDGKEYPVTWTDVDKAKQLYPAVDIEQEIRNMYGWLDGHQSNRKTWGGMKRFINSWLARAQNNAHVVQQKPQPRQVVNAFAEYAERLAREGAQ